MRHLSPILLVVVLALFASVARAIEMEIAELSFDSRLELPNALAEARQPAWVTKVEQQGGRFLDEPRCWEVATTAPEGVGRLAVTLDRTKLTTDLVASVLFEAGDATDVAVQLFDAQGRVVVLDLFGNLVDVGREAMTNTLIIPLRKYPTAERIVVRRIKGGLKVFGVVLYPVAAEGEADQEELKKLAAVLNDPLSPENPLLKGLQNVARSGNVALTTTKPAPTTGAASDAPVRKIYPAAAPPPKGAAAVGVPEDGLIAWWNFDRGDGSDASGNKHHGHLQERAQFVDGVRGKGLRLVRDRLESVLVRPAAAFELTDSLTVTAWIQYATIAPTWGSQIVWFGDEQLGRDPWLLHLLPDGTLQFRSDRSVTGKPVFTVFDSEIQLSPKGEKIVSQHVAADSAGTLAPNRWYFVAGTLGKVSARQRALRVYVNGELAGETVTDEVVNYETSGMAVTLGAVDRGHWQNFDGVMDEVRVYRRALSPGEIRALYHQPRP